MKTVYLLNCWEFKKCGREPNGINVTKLGVCPAASCENVDGIHNGKNGGRCCWVFKASEARKEGIDCYTGEFIECHTCDFYKMVRDSSPLIVII
jgi:hypothetical protein